MDRRGSHRSAWLRWLLLAALTCTPWTHQAFAQTAPGADEEITAAEQRVIDERVARLEKLYGDFDWLDGTVVGIVDGDTLDVKVSARKVERVRLVEIDAPEEGAPYSKAAKKQLSDLTFGQEIGVAVVARDRDKRVVGRVFAPGDDDLIDVSREMVAKGAAWYFDNFGKDRSLLIDQSAARKQGLGLWALPENQRVPPWEWRKMPKAERDKHR
jgi:endonuclease YncB( thermonuclease family)